MATENSASVWILGTLGLTAIAFTTYHFIFAKHNGKYGPGDVLAVWVDTNFDYVTIMNQSEDQYQIVNGWYPDTVGGPTWQDIKGIDQDPSVTKVGHVEL
jgi:hypothetical protein